MRQERRQVPRDAVSWVGRYRFEGQGSWGLCRVVDISLIGAGVDLRGTVPKDCIGRRVVVNAESPADLRFVGECRHAKRFRTGRTRIGVEFTLVSTSDEWPRTLVDAIAAHN